LGAGKRFACSGAVAVSNYGASLEVGTDEPGMVNQRNLVKLLSVVLFGLSARNAAANGFGLADQDAFATGRGDAVVATADNPSAIFYNPAGIALLTGNNFRSGLDSVYYQPSFEPPSGRRNNGRTYYSSDNFAYIPHLFYSYTAKGAPLSIGLGIYSPYGGAMNWPQDTGFNSVAISGSLKYITINPVVAVKLLPSLSVGGGAMVNYGKISMYQGLRPYPTPLTNYFNFSGNGWSVGYNAGILWQPRPMISFGATFRSSARLNFQGETDFQQQAILPAASRTANAEFTFPLTTVFGVSVRPTPKWNLEFDANYTGWNSFGTVTIQQQTPVPPPLDRSGNIPVNLNWQGSWMYQFGVTRYFDNGWHASGGYVYNENSVPDEYYSPLAADLNRDFFSLGIGFQGKTFNFDLAYQFGYAPKNTVSGSKPSSSPAFSAGQNADGQYGFTSQAIIATVGMHF
jgi:long-chain fatty acid transport protein